MGRFHAKYRFFLILAGIVFIYLLCFVFNWPLWAGHAPLMLLLAVFLFELISLHLIRPKINVTRIVNDQLSLSDRQLIKYKVNNESRLHIIGLLVDELPAQLQHRKHIASFETEREDEQEFKYQIRPTIRGEYYFGQAHLFFTTKFLQLVEIRQTYELAKTVEVYPSFIQMKQLELETFKKVATRSGIKQIRRVGQNDEFEHIRNYAHGDNFKSINWKASSRKSELMINQYQDTRSQSVYCIIDKGRSMEMPFEELSLLDYSINATLVISNIILKKYDHSGLITFNESLGSFVKADNKKGQLNLISKHLFKEETSFKDSSYQDLYFFIRRKLSRRSILILFGNFEHSYDMERALPYLKRLNRLHLLVVIFFTNTELQNAGQQKAEKTSDIYRITFAQKALLEKEKIQEKLSAHGIQAIYTTPQNLSVNVINKYLEIKAKRMG